jgi:hypothetical protein
MHLFSTKFIHAAQNRNPKSLFPLILIGNKCPYLTTPMHYLAF